MADPKPMPVQFAGPEPYAIPLWLLCCALAVLAFLAIVGAGALWAHFFP